LLAGVIAACKAWVAITNGLKSTGLVTYKAAVAYNAKSIALIY